MICALLGQDVRCAFTGPLVLCVFFLKNIGKYRILGGCMLLCSENIRVIAFGRGWRPPEAHG